MTMHNRWHPELQPVAGVAPGEELTLETEDGLAGQLGPGSTHEDVGTLDLGRGHPLAGPVHVDGAEPGDLLEVDFVAYGGLAAQIVTPVFLDGRLAAIVSLHQLETPRAWSEHERDLAHEAAERVRALIAA